MPLLDDDDLRKDKLKDTKIDFDFYDSIAENDDGNDEECNLGVKKVQIKPQETVRSTEVTDENNSQNKDIYINNSDCDLEGSVTKCIAYETNCEIEESLSGLSDGEVSPILGSSLSESTQSSELTNVTPLTSSSSYSSLNKEKLDDDVCSLNDESPKNEMKLLADAVETLSLQNKVRRISSIPVSTSRLAARPKRKNMTFTNDELRKIDRENDILLKKIMVYSKPGPKNMFKNKSPPRTVKASAAVNRSKKQREIERENHILFQKIRSAKPTQSYTNTR